jgi:hypothetical protein
MESGLGRTAISIAAALVFAFVFAAFSARAGETELSSISQEWRNVTYYDLLAEFRPRNPDKMKFIFLGEPIPCVYEGVSGYGGFVHMRKDGFLWFDGSSTYFYVVNGNGMLCSIVSVNSLDESSVYPQMVDVEITRERVWVPAEWGYERVPDGKGGYEMERVETEPAHYETVVRRNVHPIMESYEKARLSAFIDTKLDSLPAYQ